MSQFLQIFPGLIAAVIMIDNLMEAVKALEKDPLICGVLGSHICKRYIEAKKEEWKDYCAAVSNWEIDRYLVNI